MNDYKTALITGASSGIGRALAKRLAGQGTEVTLCARRQDELEVLAAEIQASGGRARVEPLDVADTEKVVQSVRAVDESVGGLDLIIANAGVGVGSKDASPFSWEAVSGPCAINFSGAVATLTAVLPQMVARGRGHIVGVSTLAAFGPLPESASYCGPKAGLSMFLACLQLDLEGTGVFATPIHPGFVKTPMTAKTTRPMPFLMECDDAIDIIMSELPKHPPTIDFPTPLALAARLGGLLPPGARSFFLRRPAFRRTKP
jgi:short-subunit dehydrogenase